MSKYDFFKEDSDLTEQQKKYCSCVLDVAGKQTPECLHQRAWRKVVAGEKCYMPWAVCAKSVGTTSRKCAANFNFFNMTDDQLKAYANLNRIDIPRPYNRNSMLENINHYKSEKYGIE